MKKRIIFGITVAAVFAISTNDAFAQWYNIPQLRYSRVWSIMATNDSTIFVGADNATLLRSTDGGITWNNLITWQNGLEADTILSLAQGGGYIFAGTNGPGGLYRSSNNGDSWSLAGQGFPGNTAINGMTYSNGVIYAAANIGVYASTDSGESWKADTAGLNMGPWYEYNVTPSGIVGITAVDSTLFALRSWDVQVSGGVYTTNVNSIQWRPIGLESLPSYGLFAVAAVDTNVFVATGQGMYLYSGSGTTWLPRNNGLPVNDTTSLTATIFAREDTMLFAYVSYSSNYSYARGIFLTTDLGQTWTRVKDSVASQSAVNSMVATSKYLFAGTQSGAWRIPITDVITSVKDDNPQLPSKFALYQNFPNPFNPMTTIKYGLSSKQFVVLNVYNVLGQRVATLVNEWQNAGTHSVTFDGTNLPSGVYFYRLSAGSYIATKKALLLK